ncbi:hypothetical protein Tco_0748385 [Tanacetum coccineum]|uniref:Reverse transcriptase n=1 Tax=Tanacetum coccineum TaxID=301880 RepID=A0ABQ4YVH4_9ASTR
MKVPRYFKTRFHQNLKTPEVSSFHATSTKLSHAMLLPTLVLALTSCHNPYTQNYLLKLSNSETCFSIDVIEEILEEDIDALLDEGSIIYPIADSPWVSPIHCVSKKGVITVVTNERNELVPTRTVTESVKVFMDDFSIFRSSFDHYLSNLDKMLQLCKDAHLVLNWEKCHFMVKEGIVLGHKVSEAGLEIEKAKIKVISKLPPPLISKELEAFWDMPVSTEDSL